MTRAAAKVHVDDAQTDLAAALVDAPKCDPIHKMIQDVVQRLNYILTRLRD